MRTIRAVEGEQNGERTVGGHLEDRAVVVSAAIVRCAVKVTIRALPQTRLRSSAISAVESDQGGERDVAPRPGRWEAQVQSRVRAQPVPRHRGKVIHRERQQAGCIHAYRHQVPAAANVRQGAGVAIIGREPPLKPSRRGRAVRIH